MVIGIIIYFCKEVWKVSEKYNWRFEWMERILYFWLSGFIKVLFSFKLIYKFYICLIKILVIYFLIW